MNRHEDDEDALETEQQLSIQRLLGRCLLKLQEYERLLKRVLPYSSLSGQPTDVSAQIAAASSSLHKSMMGSLVGTLVDKVLVSDETQLNTERLTQVNGSNIWVQSRTQIVLTKEQYTKVKSALKQLVTLRNDLVHQFIDTFDLNTKQGCAYAETHLTQSLAYIDEQLVTLRGWTQNMVKAQTLMASALSDKVFADFLDGICPDGFVIWARSGIVQGLRDAEAHLAVDGWTPLHIAIDWMQVNAAEHTPRRYGCNTWRQVLHESRQFEVCKKTSAEISVRSSPPYTTSVWFRSRRQDDMR